MDNIEIYAHQAVFTSYQIQVKLISPEVKNII